MQTTKRFKAHVKQASEKKEMILHMPYAVRSTAGDDHVSVIWGGDWLDQSVWYLISHQQSVVWTSCRQSQFNQSPSDTSRTGRQKGLVSAQCEFEYELSCNPRDMNLLIDPFAAKQQADWQWLPRPPRSTGKPLARPHQASLASKHEVRLYGVCIDLFNHWPNQRVLFLVNYVVEHCCVRI